MKVVVLMTAVVLLASLNQATAKTIYIAISNPDMSFLSGGVA